MEGVVRKKILHQKEELVQEQPLHFHFKRSMVTGLEVTAAAFPHLLCGVLLNTKKAESIPEHTI